MIAAATVEFSRDVENKKAWWIVPDGVTPPDELKTMPHGFDKDDPAAKYLRSEGYVANRAVSNLPCIGVRAMFSDRTEAGTE